MMPNLERHIYGDHDTLPSIDDERRDQIRRDVEDEMTATNHQKGDYDEFREQRPPHGDSSDRGPDAVEQSKQDGQTSLHGCAPTTDTSGDALDR